MKTRTVLALIGVLVLAQACLTRSARGQTVPDFWHYSTTQINPDQNSGLINTGAFGDRAVPVTAQTNVEVRHGNNIDELRLWTFGSVSGNFVNQGAANGPFYDAMENYGIQSSGSISLSQVTVGTYMGDISYQFDTIVHVQANCFGGIYRRPNDILTGIFQFEVTAEGAIPLNSSVEIVIYPTSHPDFVPDWQIYSTTEWLVTGQFHQVQTPTPGASALLGLGGLLAARRRR